jgi:hypothetical protein
MADKPFVLGRQSLAAKIIGSQHFASHSNPFLPSYSRKLGPDRE